MSFTHVSYKRNNSCSTINDGECACGCNAYEPCNREGCHHCSAKPKIFKFKLAALEVRNVARELANASPANARRRERAIGLFKNKRNLNVKISVSESGVRMVYVNGRGTYDVNLYRDGEIDGITSCTCPDARNPTRLCKHVILLAAIIIDTSSNVKQHTS
jgi:hypothetical protein